MDVSGQPGVSPCDGQSHAYGLAMDSPEEAEDRPRVHYSTGRLNPKQARTVDKWRNRLRLDRPLPGVERKGEVLRLLGLDDRPPTSCSNVLAAAVVSLLEEEQPDELAVARYADKSNQDRTRRIQPVSFYLAAEHADTHNDLVRGTQPAVIQFHDRARREAMERFPTDLDAAQRWYMAELHQHGVPFQVPTVPRGVLVRMAIDRWARRAVDEAVAAGVAYAADILTKPQRARRDMLDNLDG
jgi:hypothetical protein